MIFRISESKIQFRRYNMPEKGVAFMRTVLGATTEIEDGCDHSIIERENYNIHLIRPQGLEGDLPAVVAIHGGGWVLGAVDGMYKFYSNMALETKVRSKLLCFNLTE